MIFIAHKFCVQTFFGVTYCHPPLLSGALKDDVDFVPAALRKNPELQLADCFMKFINYESFYASLLTMPIDGSFQIINCAKYLINPLNLDINLKFLVNFIKNRNFYHF